MGALKASADGGQRHISVFGVALIANFDGEGRGRIVGTEGGQLICWNVMLYIPTVIIY